MEKRADSSDPWFHAFPPYPGTATTRLVWRQPSCHSVPGSSLILGHKMIALFLNLDCRANGHFGYTWIDDICGKDPGIGFTIPSQVCNGQPIPFDATQTMGATTATLTMVQCDVNGNNLVPATLVTQTVVGQNPPPFNLVGWYTSAAHGNHQLTCNKYYKVTLRADTECGHNLTTSHIVFVKCCKGIGSETEAMCFNPATKANGG